MTLKWAGIPMMLGMMQELEALSQDRVDAVKSYLVKVKMFPESRIVATGFGESMPIADSHAAKGKGTKQEGLNWNWILKGPLVWGINLPLPVYT